MIISCSKNFVRTTADKYTESDIAHFDFCIAEGVRAIKKWTINSEGAYSLLETKTGLTITADEVSFSNCFEDIEDGKSEFKGFINGILRTIDNYAIPLQVQP